MFKGRFKMSKYLEPFNVVVQVCPVCGKVDVYKDDGHDCFQYL